jgi:hypothetical protein
VVVEVVTVHGVDFSVLVEQVARRTTEKVARFLEMLRDPDLAPYVAALRNGHEHKQSPSPARLDQSAGFKIGNGIREAVIALPLPQRFTGEDVLAALEASDFQFSSRERKAAVRDALFKLSRGANPFFKIIKKGAGGKPNIYEKIRRDEHMTLIS